MKNYEGAFMRARFLLHLSCFLFVICSFPQKLSAEESFDNKIKSALSGDHRSIKNKARDKFRNPFQTLKFFGIRPESKVLEISPGRGWYSEVLAPIFRDSGEFYVATWDIPSLPERIRPYLSKIDGSYRESLKKLPSVYDQVKIITYSSKNPNFGSSNTYDFILTFRNVHNWAARGSDEKMFSSFFDALKAGGVLGVTDHRARPGTPFADQTKSGYMTEDYVINLAKKVGFELAEKSEINANPKDTADHPGGVWNLPPTLRDVSDSDRERYLAIGESDRMTLRFMKPQN